MPTYQAGEHKVDHPPLFACREHKQFLRLTTSFVLEIVTQAADMVPGNLSEIAAPHVGGNEDAFRLPEYLIPPRVILYNPDNVRGPAGLPFTLIFIDKRFVGIPAVYLTRERFEGCAECAVIQRQEAEEAGGARVARPSSAASVMRPGSAPGRTAPAAAPAAAPVRRPASPASGPTPSARPPAARPPGSGTGPSPVTFRPASSGSKASDALKGHPPHEKGKPHPHRPGSP